MAKNIVLIIAHQGYQQTEYNIPKKILTDAGIKIITASDEPGVATAKDSSTTSVDITIDQLNPADYDGFFLIGGPGALDCLDNATMHTLLQDIAKLKKLYGAICISPRILAKAGVLAHKKATGWDDDNKLEPIFNHHKVIYTRQPTVVDGNIITATGPSAAEEFAQAILAALQ